MSLKEEYYKEQYEELKVLSDTDKCKTVLERNVDTGELAVKKIMEKEAYGIYSVIKQISNSHLVHIFDCFETESGCIEYEEYINGKKLDSIIGENGLPVKEVIEYCLQICEALNEVHRHGIVHRDISPANIVITNENVLKLIDFDIARIEKESSDKDTKILGTAGYASPEQYGFAQTDGRSDIYSIGILMKEMITGKTNATDDEIRKKIVLENLENKAKIKEESLLNIIHKCTQMDADRRYKNVKQLSDALEKCQSGMGRVSENIETRDKKSDTEKEELPPLSFYNILHSVPGFKSENIFFEVFAVAVYGFFLSAFAAAGYEQEVFRFARILVAFVFMLMFAGPFICITNIGQIAQRLTKRKFKSVGERIFFQIIYGVITFLVIVIVAFVLTSCFSDKI